MNSFSNMTIGKKLGIALGGAAILLLGMGSISIWGMHSLRSAAEDRYKNKEAQSLSNALKADLAEIRLHLGFAANSGQDIAGNIAAVEELRKSIKQEFDELEALSSDQEDRRLLRHVREVRESGKENNVRLMKFLESGERQKAAELYNQTANSSMQKASAALAEYQEKQQKDNDAASARQAAAQSRVSFILWATGLFAAGLAVIFGILLTRSIAKPLTTAIAHLGEIAKGDLTKDAPPEFRARGDEIGTLARAKQTMIDALRKMVREILLWLPTRSRNWRSRQSLLLRTSKRALRVSKLLPRPESRKSRKSPESFMRSVA